MGLFCLLVYRGTPFLLWCGCLLSSYPSWHAPSGSNSVLPIWVVCHPSRTLLQICFPLSLPPNHALLPLTHDFTVSCISWVQASEVWALRVPSFHMCSKSTCYSLVRRGLEACLHSLPFIFWPFIWATFWFPACLRGWYLFVTGLYTSFCPFLDCSHFLPYYSIIPAIITQSC